MKRSLELEPTRIALLVLAVLLMSPLVLSNASCTAIGYSIGNSLTKNDPPRRIPAGKALRIEAGTPMEAALEDARVVRGVYLGRARLGDGEYAARYDAWRARTPDAFALASEVELVDRRGRTRTAVFRGFGYRAVSVSGAAGRIDDVPFAKLRAVRADSAREWSATRLAELDARGELPSREALAIGRGLPFDWNKQWSPGRGISAASLPAFSDTVTVPVDGVQVLSVPSARGVRTVCTLAGLAVDASLIALVAAAASIRGPFDSGGCDAGAMNFAARFAPSPTDRDFDPLAGEFVEPSAPLAAAAASDAPIPSPTEDHAATVLRTGSAAGLESVAAPAGH